MDYRRETLEYLRNYDLLQSATENLKMEIKEIQLNIKNVKPINMSGMPGAPIGSSEPDDVLVNRLFRLEKAKTEYQETVKALDRMNKTMEVFKKQRPFYAKILKAYYIDCLTEEQVAKDNGYSVRHLRRVKNQAVKAFGISIFGIKVI